MPFPTFRSREAARTTPSRLDTSRKRARPSSRNPKPCLASSSTNNTAHRHSPTDLLLTDSYTYGENDLYFLTRAMHLFHEAGDRRVKACLKDQIQISVFNDPRTPTPAFKNCYRYTAEVQAALDDPASFRSDLVRMYKFCPFYDFNTFAMAWRICSGRRG